MYAVAFGVEGIWYYVTEFHPYYWFWGLANNSEELNYDRCYSVEGYPRHFSFLIFWESSKGIYEYSDMTNYKSLCVIIWWDHDVRLHITCHILFSWFGWKYEENDLIRG